MSRQPRFEKLISQFLKSSLKLQSNSQSGVLDAMKIMLHKLICGHSMLQDELSSKAHV
jgi:vesicle coat complex subunit